MPPKLYDWLGRIKSVETEHIVIRLATDRLLVESRRDLAILSENLRLRDIADASKRLDGTYVVRLFAEFETALRQFWSAARATAPPNRVRDLLDGVASMRRIPYELLADVHLVREYRNKPEPRRLWVDVYCKLQYNSIGELIPWRNSELRRAASVLQLHSWFGWTSKARTWYPKRPDFGRSASVITFGRLPLLRRSVRCRPHAAKRLL
jgi:hypothetical protein